MSHLLIVLATIGLAAIAIAFWRRTELKRERLAESTIADLSSMGDVVAAGRYPKIDPDRCIGSGACVNACPEKQVLAITRGRGQLVNPMGCVGHGLCAINCPMDAITLVYGSATKAVELPRIDEHFQTNRKGLYIVGELSGMGLIRNAVSQGVGAAKSVIESDRRGSSDVLDAVVVGAGPAGIAATLGLLEAGLRVEQLDREELGGTIRHYPRAKLVMAGDLRFPLFGRVRRATMSKEDLMELWQKIDAKVHLPLRSGEKVDDVTTDPDGLFSVSSTSGITRAANVILALGRRGSPRKLGVPGEAATKVCYSLLEPTEFSGQHVLVVGGGNSAVESAISLAQDGGCASVAISYRRSEFARCRGENRKRIHELIEANEVRALLGTNLVDITDEEATLKHQDGREEGIENDAIIVQVGGTPPTKLLQKFGVQLIEKRGDE